jgi:hypothetical protein
MQQRARLIKKNNNKSFDIDRFIEKSLKCELL